MYKLINDYLKEDKLLAEALVATWTTNAQIPRVFKDTTEQLPPEATPIHKDPFKMGESDVIKRSVFITVAFPNHEYLMKYKEPTTKGVIVKEGLIKYFKCMPSEQHEFVSKQLKKHLAVMFFESLIDYDIFYELTKNGNIHIHGRMTFNKKLPDKEIKLSFHRIFKTPTKYIRTHVDIKDYNSDLWHDYHIKKEKGYQTTEHPHFTNIF